MTAEIENIQYSPIQSYRYEQFFEETYYNGNPLEDVTRKQLVSIIDEDVAHYSEGLPLLTNMLERFKDHDDVGHHVYGVTVSVMQFTLMTMIDSMVISKYFILADKDYDKRFMRGKMRVVLNEGFKKLYGFEEKTRKNSEWGRLTNILKYFPEEIIQQHQQLSSLLEGLSQSSSWWKDERDIETHLDTERLYASRSEEIVEGKVMLDSLKLFDTLLAVNFFLGNMHTCLRNSLLDKYLRGELKEEN